MEVSLKILDHLLCGTLHTGSAKSVNGCEGGTLSRVVQLLELALGSLADRTLFGSLSSLIDITTNCANKFLLHNAKCFVY